MEKTSQQSLSSISIENFKGELGFEYWWRWQVLVCALIVVTPALVCLVLIQKKLKEGSSLSHGCLWVPCWRGLHPKWLLLYRLLAFLYMARLLYRMIAFGGLFMFYFYTQWTFALVMVYFAIAVIMSTQGCWLYYTEARSSAKNASLKGKEKVGSNLQKQFSLEKANEPAGFWGHVMHTIYQVSVAASVLTDIVFWCVLVPMLSGKEFQLTMVISLIHSVNIVFLIIDSSLSNLVLCGMLLLTNARSSFHYQSYKWSGFTYFAWWSVIYTAFQWSLHACGFKKWPYPFLELATPWAPLCYLGMALFHFPIYGIYMVFMKAMTSAFSRLFPHAYIRLNQEMAHEKTM